MPGKRESSVTRRLTGGASIVVEVRARPGSHTGQAERAPEVAEAARGGAELALLQLLRRAERLVEGGKDEVLEELDVFGVDRVRIDRHLDDLELSRHHDLDRAAAGGRFDALVLQLLLRLRHLGLHLLDLLEHLVHVRRLRHRQVPSSSSKTSSALNSAFRRSSSSSSESAASGSSSPGGGAPRSNFTATERPVRPRSAVWSSSRLASAFLRENSAPSG